MPRGRENTDCRTGQGGVTLFNRLARDAAVRRAAKDHKSDKVSISIRDFGPIHSGDIEIMPMTVLIGSNNSGKSYASLLIRSALTYSRGLGSHLVFPRPLRATAPRPSANRMSAQDYADRATREAVDSFKARILHDIKRAFSDDLPSMIRIGADRCTIKIRTGRITARVSISNKGSTCRVWPAKKLSVAPGAAQNKGLEYRVDGDSVVISAPRSVRGLETHLAEFMRGYFDPDAVFYFPAARSGILQGHNAISAGIVGHATYAGPEIEIPRLPGAIADFIAGIIRIAGKRGPFYDTAADLEQEMLQGEIRIEHRYPASDIKYVYKKREMPIHLASSAVSEMAPFVLYLKHMVSKESTLIIEEPESHMHPHNQAILAKYLVRLVRRGLRVVLTTHSPFIVEQISNMVQAGSIAKAGTAGPKTDLVKGGRPGIPGLKRDDYLEAKEVAAYELVPSPSGYDIDRLKVRKDEGIPVEEFVKASDRLYRQSLAIRDRAGDGS